MKTSSHISIRIKTALYVLMLSLFSLFGYSAEFVIINDTIDYPNTTDNNGFYFFYYNSSMPVNWLAPNDYVHGQVYSRFEIISQVSSEPVGLQFGVWQKLPPVTGTLYENMDEVSTLYGPGDTITNHTSPSTWWTYNGGADWTKMDQVWHFGINPYKMDPYQQQIRSENADVWAERFLYWFPMKVRVTVVAVSSGSVFTGWNNYLGTKPATPNYAINYTTEKTNKVVPATDEYSYSPGMTPAYSGTGAILSLTPGQNVYFRTKAVGYNPASEIQQLTVSARPSITSFTVDFNNVRTNQVVPVNVVYSASSDFTSPTNGDGTQLTLTPGQDLYFRVNPTASSFASATIHLIVPARPDAPAVSVNFATEKTNEILGNSVEYATDISMGSTVSCANTALDLVPGTDLFFRVKATGSTFASLITFLDVPARPSPPAISLNYSTETTSVIGSTIEWDDNADMSSATLGLGTSLTVTPGTDLYFRIKVSSIAFQSAVQHLNVPDRPVTPAYSINYTTERTSGVVVASDDYSVNSNMSVPAAGNNATIALTPGTDLYFRTRATPGSFASLIQQLDVPSRPGTPSFSIDYINRSTAQPVADNIEYSLQPGFTSADIGANQPIQLEPGQSLYFRQIAGVASFRSAIFELEVPEANFLGYSGSGTIIEPSFMVYAILADDAMEFNLSNLEITNGTAANLRQGTIFDVYPASVGEVTVEIPANSTINNSFASNIITVYYAGPDAAPEFSSAMPFTMYPNPSYDGIIHIKSNVNSVSVIEIISGEGRIIKKMECFENGTQTVNLQELQSGIYFVKFNSPDHVSVQKIMLQ